MPVVLTTPEVKPLRATDHVPSERSWKTCEPAAPILVVKYPQLVGLPVQLCSGLGGVFGTHVGPDHADPFHAGDSTIE